MNIHQAEAIIETSPDHRLLRRIPDSAKWKLPRSQADTVRAVFIDTVQQNNVRNVVAAQ